MVGSLSTLWELPEGFSEAMADAYREANGQPVTVNHRDSLSRDTNCRTQSRRRLI